MAVQQAEALASKTLVLATTSSNNNNRAQHAK
jgi:hypothetical protein